MLPGLFFLNAYPPEQIWRLFVDGRFWSTEKGWQGYESREPGSINAALESLCSIALHVDKAGEKFELSVDLIKDIHKKCGRQVEELQDKGPGEVRTDEPVSFGIPASRASIKGIEEFLGLFFLREGEAEFGPGKPGGFGHPRFDINYFKDLTSERIPELARKIYEDMSQNGHNNPNHFYLAIRKNVDFFLEAITSSYNTEIKAAKTIDEKLQVIAKHIRYYEVLHPFKDANGRTFVNNLLNILLMQQALPPATFYEPNVFDLYSADELVVVIKEAIFNTVEIIEKNKKDFSLYGYKPSQEDREKFMELLDSPSYKEIQWIDFSHLNVETLRGNTRDCLASLNKIYPLHRGAIYLRDPGDIKELVSVNKSQINERIREGAPPLYVGKTPMHIAVMMHNTALIDELVDQKADLSIQDFDGKTALHYAAESGDMHIMEKILNALVLQEGAHKVVNLKDNLGKTAFHYAAEYGSQESVSALLSTDIIQINEPDNRGASAITLAYKNNKLDVFEKLLNSGAEISKELLDAILTRNDAEALRKVIAKNEKILLSTAAFNVAVCLGSKSLVKKFLHAGMDIDTPLTKDKATPLMLAVSQGDAKLTEYLLRKGANTSLTDVEGNTALHYVCYTSQKNRDALTKVITDKDNTLIDKPNSRLRPPLFSAVALRDFKMMQTLLEMGAKTDFEDNEGNTLLHGAINRCDLPMIHDLISRNRKLLHKKNFEGRNPFHHALNDSTSVHYSKEQENKFIELIDLLLKEKVDLNAKDKLKKTILDIALSKQCYHLCIKLMKVGAHTNISSAEKLLKKAESSSILEHPTTFKQELMKKLNEDPLIAIAQLNDLYIKIRKNEIRTPKDFVPKGGLSFFTGKSEDTHAHEQVLSVLKEIYESKLKELLSQQGERKGLDKKPQFLDENLRFLIKTQEISKKIDKPSVQVIEGESYKIRW